MLHSLHITIADFLIQLQSQVAIEIEEGYIPFLVDDSNDVPHLTIRCYEGLPQMPNSKELVFEAQNEEQKFYSIYRSGADLLFVIYNQELKNEVQQMAVLDADYTHWQVYANPNSSCSKWALLYPLGPIVMYYLVVKYKAIMMHASCVFDGAVGRIFTGFSGNGKSTMSKIWAEAGNMVVNDDRIIVRECEGKFYVYNTPMYYPDKSKKVVLGGVFLIGHSPTNNIKKISGGLAVSKVLAFCIQNNFDKTHIHNHLELISALCERIPVYELGFVPNQSVVDFVLANE